MAEFSWLAVLIGGFLFTYRRAYLLLQEYMTNGSPDAEDRVFGAIIALLISLLWPVVLVGYLVYRLATPTTPGEHKAELDERERRIRQLERELRIDP